MYMSKERIYLQEKNILFCCTTLHRNSTLSKNFDTINSEITKIIPTNVIKKSYLVYTFQTVLNDDIKREINAMKSENSMEDKLKINNYDIIKNGDIYVNDKTIIEFMKDNRQIKYDIVCFSQCNELLSYFCDREDKIHRGRDIIDYVKNFIIFYEQLNENAILLNYYYTPVGNDVILKNFSETLSYPTSNAFKLFLIINYVLERCFEKLDVGFYIKRRNISSKEICNLFILGLDNVTTLIENIFVELRKRREKYIEKHRGIISEDEIIKKTKRADKRFIFTVLFPKMDINFFSADEIIRDEQFYAGLIEPTKEKIESIEILSNSF